MTEDVSSRVLQLFEVRLKNNPDVSRETITTLLEEQRANDFGDDETIMTQLIEAEEDRE